MNIPGHCVFQRRLLTTSIAGILFASTALAQTPGDSVQLAPLEISEKAPADTDLVIENRELDVLQANDLEDVFRNEPSVSVGGSNKISQKIYVRGIEDTLLNVTIDGATQAGYLFHHQGRLAIEPDLLKQVEVQAGAGAATNGPGALGGAIRFVTKDPQDLLRPGEQIGALLKGGYFTNTKGYKASANLFGRITDDWSALATVSKLEEDEIRDGRGERMTHTDTNEELGMAKIVGQLTESQRLSLSHERNDNDGFRLERPHWVPSPRNRGIPSESHRDTSTVNYFFEPAGSPYVALGATLYQTESYIVQDGRFGEYFGGVESRGLDLRNTSRIAQHTLTYGVDHRRDDGELRNRTDATVPVEEEKVRITGLYLQDEYLFADQWSLGIGTRYDLYRLDDANGQEFDDEGFSPNASLTFFATPALSFYVSYAEAFRGKQINEVYILDAYTNDPELDSERAKNAETGFDFHDGPLLIAGKIYYSRIEDVIDDVDRVLTNVGDVKTKGFSTRVAYSWDQLQAGLSFNYNRPELNGEPLNDDNWSIGAALGNTWVADLSYRLNDHIEFGWYGRFVDRLKHVATGYNEKPGFGVHDIYAQWLPFQTDDLTLTLTVKNLFDKFYRDHASYGDYGPIAQGWPEPGRDIRLSVAWRI